MLIDAKWYVADKSGPQEKEPRKARKKKYKINRNNFEANKSNIVNAVQIHNSVLHSRIANRFWWCDLAIYDPSQCGPYNVCYFPSAHTLAAASYINY